jgi:hypothetical protein
VKFWLVFTDSYGRRAAKWIKKRPALRRQYLKAPGLMGASTHHSGHINRKAD